MNGFKLIEASVKNNEVRLLLFEDDNTKELFIVNKHQLNNIIEKKLSKNEFKPKRDLLEADAIAPIKARIAPYIH